MTARCSGGTQEHGCIADLSAAIPRTGFRARSRRWAQGRGTVTCQAVRAGGDGEKWAVGLGFSKVEELALPVLVVADVDPGRWEAMSPTTLPLV
jgi:hypothetical protein